MRGCRPKAQESPCSSDSGRSYPRSRPQFAALFPIERTSERHRDALSRRLIDAPGSGVVCATASCKDGSDGLTALSMRRRTPRLRPEETPRLPLRNEGRHILRPAQQFSFVAVGEPSRGVPLRPLEIQSRSAHRRQPVRPGGSAFVDAGVWLGSREAADSSSSARSRRCCKSIIAAEGRAEARV